MIHGRPSLWPHLFVTLVCFVVPEYPIGFISQHPIYLESPVFLFVGIFGVSGCESPGGGFGEVEFLAQEFREDRLLAVIGE